MIWLLRISAFFLLLITALPLIPTGKWYVRWWDFPRLQIAALLLLILTVVICLAIKSGFQRETTVWAFLLAAGVFWQGSHIVPFSKLWPTEVKAISKGQMGVRIVVSNLDYENEDPESVSAELMDENPDILLLVEYDDEWHRRLSDIRNDFPFRHEEVRGEGLGMAIWSKLPFDSAETRHLVSDRRASLWVKLNLNSGAPVNFVGVHPTPPGLKDSTGEARRDSRVRDAELILIAKEIASRNDESWIVAGDFNDVAWSHTTRLFKRISGVKDPRIGRSFMGTYIANNPLCRCPIDHVFLSKGFSIADLDRKRITGSDHFAVLATVALTQPHVGVEPEPKANDIEDAKGIIEEGKEHAENRDVDAS